MALSNAERHEGGHRLKFPKGGFVIIFPSCPAMWVGLYHQLSDIRSSLNLVPTHAERRGDILSSSLIKLWGVFALHIPRPTLHKVGRGSCLLYSHVLWGSFLTTPYQHCKKAERQIGGDISIIPCLAGGFMI